MSDSLLYKIKSGKPPKILFYIKNYFLLLIPNFLYRRCLHRTLRKVECRKDYEYIKTRVNYYNQIAHRWELPSDNSFERELGFVKMIGKVEDFKLSTFHKAYFFDSIEITRWFSRSLRWSYCPGDVYFTPEQPTLVKSRLLHTNNTNSVLLKLDKFRHFIFLNDHKNFRKKQNRAIFRGKIRHSRIREQFLKLYFDNPLLDCGVVGKNEGCPERWMTPKKTFQEHLDYKFIMTLEGNDVASNLKWVMSSNSVAVMPPPTCETWFMEGTLIPNYHYIAIHPDLSDLEDKLLYYIEHPEEAEAIIQHAHDYVKQFKNKKREKLIGLLVMQKYFQTSGQIGK